MKVLLCLALLLISNFSSADEVSAVYLFDSEGREVIEDTSLIVAQYLAGVEMGLCFEGSAEEIIEKFFTAGEKLYLEESIGSDAVLTAAYTDEHGDLVVAFDYIDIDDNDVIALSKCN